MLNTAYTHTPGEAAGDIAHDHVVATGLGELNVGQVQRRSGLAAQRCSLVPPLVAQGRRAGGGHGESRGLADRHGLSIQRQRLPQLLFIEPQHVYQWAQPGQHLGLQVVEDSLAVRWVSDRRVGAQHPEDLRGLRAAQCLLLLRQRAGQ